MVDLNRKEDLNSIDWTDSNALFDFGLETVRIATQYQSARTTYARAVRDMNFEIARRFKDGSVDRKMAYDKLLILVSNKGDKERELYNTMLVEQQNYKGLEKVLESRQAVVSLAQSLIKNRVSNE
jgi:hypothetical protein